MKEYFTVRIMAAFVVVLCLSMNVWAQSGKTKTKKAAVSQTNRAKTTDAEIVAAIKMQFEANVEIKEQMRHINISVKKRVVTLEGWLDGKALVEKAVVLAKATKCVKRVKSRLKTQGGGSCGAGQRPCGGICIDKRSECTITN